MSLVLNMKVSDFSMIYQRFAHRIYGRFHDFTTPPYIMKGLSYRLASLSMAIFGGWQLRFFYIEIYVKKTILGEAAQSTYIGRL